MRSGTLRAQDIGIRQAALNQERGERLFALGHSPRARDLLPDASRSKGNRRPDELRLLACTFVLAAATAAVALVCAPAASDAVVALARADTSHRSHCGRSRTRSGRR